MNRITKTLLVCAVLIPTLVACGDQSDTGPVMVTPQVCLDALDYADEGFSIAGRGFEAVGDMDVPLLQQAVRDIQRVGPQYTEAREACRRAAQ